MTNVTVPTAREITVIGMQTVVEIIDTLPRPADLLINGICVTALTIHTAYTDIGKFAERVDACLVGPAKAVLGIAS